MAGHEVAIFIVNYNMPERADMLAGHILNTVKWPYSLYLIDNGSDLCDPAVHTTVFLDENIQTTGGWLAGLDAADRSGKDWLAYWFLITSAEFPEDEGDPLSSMAQWLIDNPDAVGIHPALTEDSTTAWKHLITRNGSNKPRRTWMIDNIASLWRADWFDLNGRFDPELKYGWGIDLEECFKARQQDKSIWVDETVHIKKVTDIGYSMGRMNMGARQRELLAGQNMADILSKRYGPNWWGRMLNEGIKDGWR